MAYGRRGYGLHLLNPSSDRASTPSSREAVRSWLLQAPLLLTDPSLSIMECLSPTGATSNFPSDTTVPVDSPDSAAVLVCGLDSSKLSFGEWWRLAPGISALFGWISKLFKASILESARLLVVRDSAALEIPMGELSEVASKKLLPHIEMLRTLGFGEPQVMRVTDVFTNSEIVLITQLHRSGTALSRAAFTYPLPGATSKKKTLSVGFLSQLADERFLCTDERQPKFISPPAVLARWKKGSHAVRWEAHRKNVEELQTTPVSAYTAQDVWRICDGYEKAICDFQHSRGLFVALSDADGAKVLAIASPEKARLEGAIAELSRLQAGKRRSGTGMVLLLVSIAIFAGTGKALWSWQTCALIIVALFVHELGHFIAMRWFNYRDVRMFFLPLFGAAVTGRNHNIAGWKKAVVSMMGPLPGIVLGTALAVAAAASGNDRMAGAALLVIGLNVLNLLPVLPLDGGWFWNAILFCRHRYLEAGFKLIAGFALVGGALAGVGRIWLFLGIVMLLAVPKTLRLGAAVARLRQKGWQNTDDSISRETAESIFSELSQPGKTAAAKTVAAEALTVFEHLNARPPNWLESIGLAAVYGIAIVVGFAGFGVASLALQGRGTGQLTTTETTPPVHEHVPVVPAAFSGEIAHSELPSPAANERVQRQIIATFPNADSAAASFNSLQTSTPDRLLQFGQTVIAFVPIKGNKHAKELTNLFQNKGGAVLDTGAPMTWAQFDIQFSAPSGDAARLMQEDLQTYFALPLDLRPVAPWQTGSATTPDNREVLRKASMTYVRILELQKKTEQNMELQRLMGGSPLRNLLSRKPAADRWREIRTKREQLAHAVLIKLQASGDPALDRRVIELALRQPVSGIDGGHQEANESWRAQLRQLLTGNEEQDSEGAGDYTNGSAMAAGNRITLHSMAFQNPERTLPALARFLMDAGGTDIRYGFYNAEVFEQGRLAALSK